MIGNFRKGTSKSNDIYEQCFIQYTSLCHSIRAGGLCPGHYICPIYYFCLL